MPAFDLFAASGGAGFDEGWSEGSLGGDVDVTVGIDGRVCHGIDLGVDAMAAASAQAHLRLLILGARANVGVMAHAGVHGQVTLDPNIFRTFGVQARIEAAAEVAARARLGVALEAGYVAELAAQQLDGLALQLFLAFLREIRAGGGVHGKVAYSAMAMAWAQVAGNLREDGGFTIGGGYAVGLEGGYGLDWFVNIGFDNPRRFFGTAVDLIVAEVVGELRANLPPGSDVAIELFRLLTPVGLHTAYEVGQASVTEGLASPEQLVVPFLQAFAEELQRYLIEKTLELASRQLSSLVEQALFRLLGRELSPTENQSIEAAVASLDSALSDARIDVDDVDDVVSFAIAIANLADPAMAEEFTRPLTLLWTAAVLGVSLREVGELLAHGGVSVLGIGVKARARLRPMPPVSTMPPLVLQEYLATVADFNGSALSFDHAIDYLINVGVGPLLEQQLPELAALLDQLHRATGISPGNVVTFGIQGIVGGPVSETELYRELSEFARRSVDELVRKYVFEAFEEATGASDVARLYMAEVARPSVELMVSFVFDQLDIAVADPTLLGKVEFLDTLQSGLSALLYKIVARNLVVLEQIAADTVRQQAGAATATLEQAVRSDRSNVLLRATLDHADAFLAQVSQYVPTVPGATGLTDPQVAAIQVFVAEMLSMGQEMLADAIFTSQRWSRRRQALLALLLSLDAHFDWTSKDLVAEAITTLRECSFVPDPEALQDLFAVNLEILGDQMTVVLRRVPAALSALTLALTAPRLESIASAAEQTADLAEQALAHAGQALTNLLTLLGQLTGPGGPLATAQDELAAAIEDAVDALEDLDIDELRDVLVDAGKANLRDAAEAAGWTGLAVDGLVAGFGATLDAALGIVANTVTPLESSLNAVLAAMREKTFVESALNDAVSDITATELALAGSGADFLSDTQDNLAAALSTAITTHFVPADGTPPNPVYDVGSSGFTALSATDFASAVLDAVVEMLDLEDLATTRLAVAYYDALRTSGEAQKPNLEASRASAQAERDAVAARAGTSIVCTTPMALDPDPATMLVFGPIVPLSVELRPAGSGWIRNGEARRVQIACNGRDIPIAANAWTYDAKREALALSAALRHDQGHLRAGLNTLEISLASDVNVRIRHSVSFLVDPEGPPPGDLLIVDVATSQIDAPGDDHRAAADEYVALRWDGAVPIDLTGWRVRDLAGHQYTFAQRTLGPGQTLRLHTGGDPSASDGTHCYWGRKRAVWNNDGDVIFVLDSAGLVQAQRAYGSLA